MASSGAVKDSKILESYEFIWTSNLGDKWVDPRRILLFSDLKIIDDKNKFDCYDCLRLLWVFGIVMTVRDCFDCSGLLWLFGIVMTVQES